MKTAMEHNILAELIIDEAVNSLTQKPLESTTIERIRLFHEADMSYRNEPQQIKYGKGIYYALENSTVIIEKTDLILGRVPEKVLDEAEEKIFQSLNKNNGRPDWISDSGHMSFSWDEFIKSGFTGLREKAVSELERRYDEGTCADRLSFLEGAVWIYDAMILLAERYADAAQSMGLYEAAETCHAVASHAPKTFREALQGMWFIHMVYCSYLASNPTLTLGRLDLFLEELYNQDIENGTITSQDARLLILDFYCKHNLIMGRGEHQMSGGTDWARNLNYDSPQYLVLCGRRPDGTYLDGELTHLFVETIVPKFKNPVIEIRYAPNMKEKCPKLWHIIAEKMQQSASLMVYNEEDCISAYLAAGVDYEDAIAFEHYGCNHPTLPGISGIVSYSESMCHIPVNDFMFLLTKWVSEGHEPQSSDELVNGIAEIIKNKSEEIIKKYNDKYVSRMTNPHTLLQMADCFLRYSIPAAYPFGSYGSKYQTLILQILSYATFVDCFTAVDELVIKQKKMTLAHLMKAVSSNFDGYSIELALCKKSPKLGSDSPIANKNAHELMTRFMDDASLIAKEVFAENENSFVIDNAPVIPRQIMCFSMEGDNSHLIGLKMGATPDGRLAGTVLSQNSAPAPGASCNGLTSRLSSTASIPFNKINAGANNVSIRPSDFSGNEGINNLASIVGGYFDIGGLQIQITAVDVNELRKAQISPDAHRDLMVRITGYSAVFVDMAKSAQDDIIHREEMRA